MTWGTPRFVNCCLLISLAIVFIFIHFTTPTHTYILPTINKRVVYEAGEGSPSYSGDGVTYQGLGPIDERYAENDDMAEQSMARQG